MSTNHKEDPHAQKARHFYIDPDKPQPKQFDENGKVTWEWISNNNTPTSKINFEPGIICRLKCGGCFMREQGLHDRKMIHSDKYKTQAWDRRYNIPFEKYKIIFEVFKFIEFCGNLSDPIYHPDFVKTLRYMKGKGMKANIRTNGSGKSKKWWTEVFQLCRGEEWWWTFALDGLPKDSHKYRINQNGEQVWEMMKYGREYGANIEWQWIVFKYNQEDIKEGNLLAAQYGMYFDYYHSTRWSGDLIKYKPDGKHAIQSRRTTDAMDAVKAMDIDVETFIDEIRPLSSEYKFESAEDFWNNYCNYDGPSILPPTLKTDIIGKRPKEEAHFIDPDCLNLDITKDIMFNSMGYFVPCCEMDQWVPELEERGFFREEFHIDNLHSVEDIKNVFMSDPWQDHWAGLWNHPDKAIKMCQTFCRKNPNTHEGGSGKDPKGFV